MGVTEECKNCQFDHLDCLMKYITDETGTSVCIDVTVVFQISLLNPFEKRVTFEKCERHI